MSPVDSPTADETPYQSCTPGLLPAVQVAQAEAVNQKFLEAWSQELSQTLEVPVTGVYLESRQPVTAVSAAGAVADCCVASMAADPGPGSVFVLLPASLLFRVLGILIGAPAEETQPGRASLTEIELNIVRPIFEQLAASLRLAWAAWPARLHDLEILPANSLENSVSAAGALLGLRSELQFGEAKETFELWIPGLTVRQLSALASPEPDSGDATIRGELRSAVQYAKVCVEAILAGSTVRMRDLLEIEPGQILALGLAADAPLECLVNGLPKFSCELAESGARTALLVAGRTATRRKDSLPKGSDSV